MFDIGTPELLIVLVIVVLLFGPGRLANRMEKLEKEFVLSKSRFRLTKSLIPCQVQMSPGNRIIL